MTAYNPLGSMDLERDFPYGSHTWKPPMDRNLKKIAYVMNGVAKSKTTPLPINAPAGDVYIGPPGSDYAGAIHISDGPDSWDVVTPRQGLTFLIEDEGAVATFFNNTWGRASTIGGSPPNDRMSVSSFHPGEPGDGYFFLRRVTSAAERILAAGPHAAYTHVPASGGDGTLVIARNGATVGTVVFPQGANDGIVSIGSDVVLAQGEVLTIRTGTANGIEDFCVTLGGRREYDVS